MLTHLACRRPHTGEVSQFVSRCVHPDVWHLVLLRRPPVRLPVSHPSRLACARRCRTCRGFVSSRSPVRWGGAGIDPMSRWLPARGFLMAGYVRTGCGPAAGRWSETGDEPVPKGADRVRMDQPSERPPAGVATSTHNARTTRAVPDASRSGVACQARQTLTAFTSP